MAEDFYFFLMHPETAIEVLRMMTPKERWQMQYRAERLKRQGKEPEKLIQGELVRFG